MNVQLGMKARRIVWSLGLCFGLVGAVAGQEYVPEPVLPLAGQAKWAVGWDAGRLFRGQAVANVERWFHPEFSVQVTGGALVTDPVTGWPVLGGEFEAAALESGTTAGIGVRFHPAPAPDAPLHAFVGFEVNRDRFEVLSEAVTNVWVHRELRALIGATHTWGEHWAVTGHVAVNATHDRYARRSAAVGSAGISAPGRVAGVQFAYRW